MIRGEVRWMVQFCHGKIRRRFFFRSKALADLKLSQLRQDREAFGRGWVDLESSERAMVCEILNEAKAKGVSLRDVWTAYKAGKVANVAGSVTVSEALKQLVAAKRARNLRENYVAHLDRTVRQFAVGKMEMRVDQFTVDDVRAYVGGVATPGGQATRRGRLLAFFGFCQGRDWLVVNPMLKIERPKIDRERPEFLPVDTCRRLVDCFCPRSLGWLALALFAGIRPQEAAQVSWQQIDLEGGTVNLDAATHKTRKPHTVTLTPSAKAWLGHARKLGAELPVAKTSLRRDMRQARDAMQWDCWSKDVLRHTFCTYGVAKFGQAWTAREADHSESVLRRHYANQAKASDAEAFFRLLPPSKNVSLSSPDLTR